jgi:hypothetical protein
MGFFSSFFRSAILVLVIVSVSTATFAAVGVGIVVSFGPPAIPVYVQPPCPAVGYIWVPGYWAWDPDFGDYYWVPGTWVLAPQVGYLWTPGYWGWNGGGYVFYQGYWGPVVGFYGGINYGFGYFGAGYVGGHWDRDQFYYNRSVTNVNVTNIHNVYNTTVINNTTVNRVSYNGGPGGITTRPTPQEEAAANERHLPPVQAQEQHLQQARSEPQLRASANQGKPPIAATDKPTNFRGSGVVAAQQAGAPYHPPANRAAAEPNRNATAPENAPTHASEVQPHQFPPPNTGNAKQDQQYQREQQQLSQQQQQEHQQLAQQQEREHQQAQQQKANQERQQQMEQQHAQQTQQMEARHAQQMQQMQGHQSPPVAHSQPKPPPKQ